MKILRLIGIGLHWLAWPVYQVYLRLSERTRVVLVHDGKILMMHQWISDGRWILPGGGLHCGEDRLAGALRELREETGITLQADALVFVGTQQYHAHAQRFTYHVFTCALPVAGPLHRQWYEVAELCWVPPTELTPYTATPDVLGSVQLVRECTRLLQ